MPDGRILIHQLQEAPYLIAFDPKTEQTAGVKLIEGYKPVTFCRRADGRILVAMDGVDRRSGALAILDGGGSLSLTTQVPSNWNAHYPRDMLQTPSGEVWVGGTAGLVRFASGHQQRFDWIEAAPGGIESKTPLQVFSTLADGQNGFSHRREAVALPLDRRTSAGSVKLTARRRYRARPRRCHLARNHKRRSPAVTARRCWTHARMECERCDGWIADGGGQRHLAGLNWTFLGHH